MSNFHSTIPWLFSFSNKRRGSVPLISTFLNIFSQLQTKQTNQKITHAWIGQICCRASSEQRGQYIKYAEPNFMAAFSICSTKRVNPEKPGFNNKAAGWWARQCIIPPWPRAPHHPILPRSNQCTQLWTSASQLFNNWICKVRPPWKAHYKQCLLNINGTICDFLNKRNRESLPKYLTCDLCSIPYPSSFSVASASS